MRLVPFDLAQADLVARWARDLRDLDHWAALDRPPTAETFSRWLADPDIHARLLADEVPIAYGEMWISAEEDEVELGRLLAAPARRNDGVGRVIVRQLLDASRAFPVSTAWVRIVPENQAAIRCYTAAGFRQASFEVEAHYNAIQPRTYRWLCAAL